MAGMENQPSIEAPAWRTLSLIGDHGSLRDRHLPPHDGVGNAGLVMSRTRSHRSGSRGRNNAHAMTVVSSQPGTRTAAPADLEVLLISCLCRLPFFRSPAELRAIASASLRATATVAFLVPARFANRVPQAFRADHFETRLRMIPVASNKYVRNNLSP